MVRLKDLLPNALDKLCPMSGIVVEGLKKSFGDFEVLHGISFSIDNGEIFGLIGPNGAGKTTTLRILATLLLPTDGHVTVFGLDLVGRASEIRKMISYLAEDSGAYRNLSGREYLRFLAKIFYDDKHEMEMAVEEAIRLSGLESRIDDKVKTYSKGMKRRLQVARVFMTSPKLAILDEPTTGLDVMHSQEIRRAIKEMSREKGITVILSSHNMFEVEYLCDRIALIDHGRILEIGTPKEVKERHGTRNLEEAFVKVIGNV